MNNSQYLLCKKSFSNEAMKPSRHLNKILPDKTKICHTLRDKFHNKKSIHSLMTNQSQKCDDGLVCSYSISRMIARPEKQYNWWTTYFALHTLVHHPFPSGIIKQFHLVIIMESRINEMAENTEEILYNILKNQQFVLQLDESTLPGNEALL